MVEKNHPSIKLSHLLLLKVRCFAENYFVELVLMNNCGSIDYHPK